AHPTTGESKAAHQSKIQLYSIQVLGWKIARTPEPRAACTAHTGKAPGQERPRQQRGQARLLGNRVTPRGSKLSATPNALHPPLSGGWAPWAAQETNQHTSL
ncbi:unnamed protein product, partial [Ixodes persulcatus]